jgi:hypothetical protein
MKTKISESIRPLLAVLLVICAFSIILILCFHTIPVANTQMINIFEGVLLASASAATGYYFGSSKGSTDKDATIANSTPNAQITANVIPPVITEVPEVKQ